MIKRNRVSEHSEFMKRLSQIEQWPDCEFAPPPPPPPSTLPLASLSHTREEITDAFQILSQQPFEYVGEGTYSEEVDGAIVTVSSAPPVQHALNRNSSLQDIKIARNSLQMQFHRDKCGSDAFLPQSQAVNKAYGICKDVVEAVGRGEIWRDPVHNPQRAAADGDGGAAASAAPCPPRWDAPCRVCGHAHKTRDQALRTEKRCFKAHQLGAEWNPADPRLNPAVPCTCAHCTVRESKRQRVT